PATDDDFGTFSTTGPSAPTDDGFGSFAATDDFGAFPSGDNDAFGSFPATDDSFPAFGSFPATDDDSFAAFGSAPAPAFSDFPAAIPSDDAGSLGWDASVLLTSGGANPESIRAALEPFVNVAL